MMTTPERVRRRQRIQGTLLIIVGLIALSTTVYEEKQRDDFVTCISDQLNTVVTVQQQGRDLNEREQQATEEFIRGAVAATTREEFLALSVKYDHALDAISRERKRLPVADPPKIACD